MALAIRNPLRIGQRRRLHRNSQAPSRRILRVPPWTDTQRQTPERSGGPDQVAAGRRMDLKELIGFVEVVLHLNVFGMHSAVRNPPNAVAITVERIIRSQRESRRGAAHSGVAASG